MADIHKEDAFDESNRGKFLQDSAFFVGAMTGLMPLQGWADYEIRS